MNVKPSEDKFSVILPFYAFVNKRTLRWLNCEEMVSYTYDRLRRSTATGQLPEEYDPSDIDIDSE